MTNPSATISGARPEIFLTPASSSYASLSNNPTPSVVDEEEEKENYMDDEFAFDIENGYITVIKNRQDNFASIFHQISQSLNLKLPSLSIEKREQEHCSVHSNVIATTIISI